MPPCARGGPGAQEWVAYTEFLTYSSELLPQGTQAPRMLGLAVSSLFWL